MSQAFLIVGQGIAGSALAFFLHQRGHRVTVVDDGHRTSATRVAAGMVNPITGKRLAKTPDWEVKWPVALAFYQALETLGGQQIYHPMPIRRLYRNEDECARMAKRLNDPDYTPYLSEASPTNAHSAMNDDYGSVVIQGGRVDTTALLQITRAYFEAEGLLVAGSLDYDELRIEPSQLRWQGERYDKVIFCDGMQVLHNPFFAPLKTDPVKGEILSLKSNTSLPHEILNKGKWLLPVSDQEARLGATYDRRAFDTQPTPEGRTELMEALRDLLPENDHLSLGESAAGVRICMQDNYPLIGLHPELSSVGLFNGFASKGNSLAPYWAKCFMDMLEGNSPLPEEILLMRAWKRLPPKSLPQ
ncbi:MAG: FAD-dependent oxidoreductase [Verrucomicrobiota bacterium]